MLARLDGDLRDIHALFAVHFGPDEPYGAAMRLNLAHLERVLAQDAFHLLRRQPEAVYGAHGDATRRRLSAAG